MHRLSLALLVGLCLSPLAAQIVDDIPPAPPEDQILYFNNDAEPETLDPAKMTGVPEHTLALGLYEGLTRHDPETLEPLPGVAESWEISEDGTVYIFKLREDAKWSNGERVTAADFVYSYQRVLDPAPVAPIQYSYMLWCLDNAEAYNKGEIESFDEVGVRAIDEGTLEIRLRASTPYFLDLISFETYMPVHKATVEKHGIKWTRPENFVGNGPFVLSAWTLNVEIVMTPNPHYWDRDKVLLREVHALAIDDQDTSVNKFLNGELHWIRSVPSTRIDELKLHPDYDASPYLGAYFYRFNTTEAPFDNPLVRKAFAMAIDRQTICERVLKGGQIPAGTHVPPGIHNYTSGEGLPYDPFRARELLAEAGFEGGAGLPSISLLYNTNESHKQVAEAIVDMWQKNLGVTVSLENTEWKVYLDRVDNFDYQIARAGWIGDYTDPNTFMDMFVTDGGNNNTGWSNPRYDELIELAATTHDQARRFEYFREAETLLCRDGVPIAPIYFYVNQFMVHEDVIGWYPNVRDLHPLRDIYIAAPE